MTVLVDTNVLVYAAERSDEAKHRRALEVLTALGPQRVVVPAQALAEFASVMTHPRKGVVSAKDVAATVGLLARACRVVPLDSRTVIAAIDAFEKWRLSHYDAQIWAAAAVSGVPTVLSEDFADGDTLGPVTFANPFRASFRVEELG